MKLYEILFENNLDSKLTSWVEEFKYNEKLYPHLKQLLSNNSDAIELLKSEFISNEFTIESFLKFIETNPNLPLETSLISALVKTNVFKQRHDVIDEGIPHEIPVFQKWLFELIDAVYSSMYDLDLLTIDQAKNLKNIQNTTTIYEFEPNEYTIQTPNFKGRILVHPEENKVEVYQSNLTFEEVLDKIGEQPADALIDHIKKHNPNILLEFDNFKINH